MEFVMNLPLVEFFNYIALVKAHRKNMEERLTAAAKAGPQAYTAAVLRELL